MNRYAFILFLLFVQTGVVSAQKAPAAANARYYRIIVLLHLTGSGNNGDPIQPEYVAQGTAIAQASLAAATAASSATAPAGPNAVAHESPSNPTQPVAPVPVSASAPPVARPGFLAWSMQKSDDGTMAIVHIVAADPDAFAAILADKRQEIRIFRIGQDSPQTIQTEMRKYKKDFDLDSFEVPVQ